MLSVTIHAGLLSERNDANVVGKLDIAYKERGVKSTYLVALALRRTGELEPAVVANYPRWSSSLWDLVARALTQVLHKSDVLPPIERVDKRCAYATKLCATIRHVTPDERGTQLATVEIRQPGTVRGRYHAEFTEDIMGPRSADFEYGCKVLNPAELLLRAICFALFGKDTLGAWPKLISPPFMVVDGREVFDIENLAEPARTGFTRYQANRLPSAKPESMALGKDYVAFLKGSSA